MASAKAKAIPGFYIAANRLLDYEFGPGQLYKVGHTGDLGSRLRDSAYVTCWPSDWAYAATFEQPTKADAFLLETAVLHCCAAFRLGDRELVRLPLSELKRVATAAATRLGLVAACREAPAYALGARARQPGQATPDGAAPKDDGPTEPPTWAAKRHLVADLVVAAASSVPGGAPMPALSAPPAPLIVPGGAAAGSPLDDDAEMSGLIDGLLACDLGPRPSPPSDEVKAPMPVTVRVTSVDSPPALPRAASASLTQDEDLDSAEVAGALAEAVAGAEAGRRALDIAAVRAVPLEARSYQRDAAAACLAELRAQGRAVLQMACRCGKTPVAYEVVRGLVARGQAACFLVPSLPLLRQTAQKLAAYGFAGPMLLVGSDPAPVPLADGRSLAMTTDPAAVRAFLAASSGSAAAPAPPQAEGAEWPALVITTYQSSPQVPAGAFALTVFDEAHRVCGGRAPRPFNHAILAPRAGARLFMTATPAYDPPATDTVTMRDRELFGGVAYRYHLRQGITAGYVNDFRLEIVAAPSAQAGTAAVMEEAAAPAQVLAAMGPATGVRKLLVFCRNIAHATRLCAALAAAARPPGTEPFLCLVAHSRLNRGGVGEALRRFSEPGRRAVLFNCRMFQEGVEIPELNGVFFASPRSAPRDIIQSLCRPLNKTPGKPTSVVFLPVLHDPALPPDDSANLKRFAAIVPFVDALLDEDPRLYEYLLDPTANAYPLGILGTHSLPGLAAKRRLLLGAVRRAIRYKGSDAARPCERLLRADTVPWALAFGEISRVVHQCGRYPKTTDLFVAGEAKANLHTLYRHYADQFVRHRAGQPCALEPYQIAALSALPGWDPYGIEGPYPWDLCMRTLERWLEENGGVPPMVNVNNGGYIGLDASDLERLSGALTVVNQADGRDRKGGLPGSGFTLHKKKQADLDRICARFGLRWRKERHPNGALVEGGVQSFIQEAYDRFKEHRKTYGDNSEFIQKHWAGFPLKHAQMERAGVKAAGLAPPRRKLPAKKKDGTPRRPFRGPKGT